MTGKSLTAAEIMAANDLKRERFPTPEWGGPDAHVYVQQIGCADMDIFIDATGNAKTKSFKMADICRIAALVIVDQDGNRLFGDADAVEKLGRRNPDVLNRIFHKALEISALTKEKVAGEKKG